MLRRMLSYLVAALVLAAFAIGVWWFSLSEEEPDAPAYQAVALHLGPISAVVSATGTLNPVNTVQVGSQVSGTIERLYADFNDRVDKGQVIAQIDPAVFRAKVAEAAANLARSEAERDKAWVSVEDAKRELDRVAELHRKKLVSASELDAARFAYDSARVEHRVTAASVAQTNAALEREQVNLAYTTIYAPIDGVVISRDVDVGQTVAASLQAPTLFTIANDLARMQVEADVDESFIGLVQEGQPVSFTVFAYPGRDFAGRVAQVRLQPNVEAGVVKYNCIILVDNADLALKPGMTATVTIEVEHREAALQVPHAALRFVPDWPAERLERLRADLEPGVAIVWRVEGEDLVPIPVTTGIIGERFTQVSSPDLAAGLRLAVPGERKDVKRRRQFSLSLF